MAQPESQRDPARSSEAPASPDPSAARLGSRPVDAPTVLVLTRFGLRKPSDLLRTYLDYRGIVAERPSKTVPGLLHSAFLIENPTTCYSLSFWESERAIRMFGTEVPSHVTAARRVFGRLRYERSSGAELWSTKWRISTVSNNVSWPEVPFWRRLRAAVET